MIEKDLKEMTDTELLFQMELIQEERRKRSKMPQKTDPESWNATMEIRDTIGGKAQIFIDGRKVPNVISYKVEQDCYGNRIPLVTLQVQCNVNLETGAIPLLPEPWSWYYIPKNEGFTSNPGSKSG